MANTRLFVLSRNPSRSSIECSCDSQVEGTSAPNPDRFFSTFLLVYDDETSRINLWKHICKIEKYSINNIINF